MNVIEFFRQKLTLALLPSLNRHDSWNKMIINQNQISVDIGKDARRFTMGRHTLRGSHTAYGGAFSSNNFTTQQADWTSHSQLLRIIVHYHTTVHV